MKIAGSGHRPVDLREPDNQIQVKARVKLQTRATLFICGMAAGFDLLAGLGAIEIGLPITAAVPYRDHRAYLPEKWKPMWDQVIEYAGDDVVYVSEDYHGSDTFHKRNRWMVDHADALMVYWNGKEEGGTFNCRKYAKEKGVPVANIIEDPPF